MNGDAAGPEERRLWRFDIERDLICVADRDGRFVSVNAAWETVLGWTRDDLLRRPVLEFVHPGDVERTAAVAARGTGPDYELVDFENRYRHADGGYRWLRWSARSDGDQWFAIASDITRHKQREQELRRVLTSERLLAYSQPIMNLHSDRLDHEELLVRVSGENGTAIPPQEFLPEAEALGLIGRVDLWMLGRAVESMNDGATLHVNLSQRTISDLELTRRIHGALAAASDHASRLVFEITETAAVETLEEARRFTESLLPLGCRFALDDFGTGYGSLTYVRQLALQYVKIDVEFIRDLVRNREDQAMVRSVIAFARELELETVAEGVENEATLEAVRELGVDYAQGYLIGRPSPLAA